MYKYSLQTRVRHGESLSRVRQSVCLNDDDDDDNDDNDNTMMTMTVR